MKRQGVRVGDNIKIDLETKIGFIWLVIGYNAGLLTIR